MFAKSIPDPPLTTPSDLTVERGSVTRWRLFAITMLFVGAAAIEAVLAAPDVSTTDPLIVHLSAGVLFALGLLLSLVRWRSFAGLTRLVIVTTTLVITALVASIDGLTMIPIFYVWPLLGSAYLLSRAEVIALSAATVALYGGALVLADQPGGFPLIDFLLTVTAGLVVVAVVRTIAENLGITIGSLRHTSSTDPLTGLLNRRGFERQFSRQYDRAVHDDHEMTALLIDIDHFKGVNDTFGHSVGDRALQRFTELLGASCRASDLVARVGGEEFAVVMPGATLEQAIARAEQFCSILRNDRAIPGIAMTASVGVATRAQAGDGWNAMLIAADSAVYEAKRTGRDRIVIAGGGAPAGTPPPAGGASAQPAT